MRHPRTLLVALAAAVALAGGLAWSRWVLSPRRDAEQVGLVPVNLPAPEVELPLAGGGTFVLSEHRGELLILSFWATWCPPCREEFPSLRRLARDLAEAHPGRVRVVAISVDDDWGPVRSFLSGQIPPGMAVGLAPGTRATGPFFCAARGRCPEEFPLPETHLVDPSGRLVGYLSGPRDWTSAELRRVLERLLD